jgi:sulfur carrier protein
MLKEMKVHVNNNVTDLDERDILFTLLKKLNLEQKRGIAVAVNAQVVLRKNWNQFELKENDHIIIIQAAQGG